MFRSASSEWHGAQTRKSCWPRDASPCWAVAGERSVIVVSAMMAYLLILSHPASGAQIFDKCCCCQDQDNDDQQPNKPHGPDHSGHHTVHHHGSPHLAGFG